MIGRIGNAYRVELAKAFRRKSTYIGLGLVLAAVLLLAAARPIVRDNTGDYDFIAYATPVALNLTGLFILVAYCAGLVSSELGRGSICLMLVRPLLRHEYVAAKLLVGMTYATLLTLTVGGAAWVCVFVFGDLSGVAYGGEALYTNLDMTAAYLAGGALALLPQFAAVAYAVMVSTLTRSTGTAIGAALGVWLLTDLVKYPLRISGFLFSSYMETPWQVFSGRCSGLDPSWWPEAAWTGATSAAFFVVFAAGAAAALARRDLRS